MYETHLQQRMRRMARQSEVKRRRVPATVT